MTQNGQSRDLVYSFAVLFTETSDVEATYHMYVENSRAGIMKRSGMDVQLISDVQTLPIYSVSQYSIFLDLYLLLEDCSNLLLLIFNASLSISIASGTLMVQNIRLAHLSFRKSEL